MLEIMNDDDELTEKRIELRQKLKSKLLTLSPSRHLYNSLFNNFIPNSRDTNFIEKQGLDCVMNYLNNNSNEFNEHFPYMCSICQLDSTQNWWCSVSDNKQSIYLCDQCEQIRLRHLIIQQHRESMKSAFLQAKESERRLEVDYQKKELNKSRRSSPYTIKNSSCKTTKLQI